MTQPPAPQPALLTEAQIISILAQAQHEWDKAHYDGWDEAYLRLMPTLYHLQAHRLHEALHLAATGVPLSG